MGEDFKTSRTEQLEAVILTSNIIQESTFLGRAALQVSGALELLEQIKKEIIRQINEDLDGEENNTSNGEEA